MTCAEARERLSAHLDGRDPEVAAHLAGCAACAEDSRRLGELRGLLRAVVEEPELVPDAGALARRVREAAARLPSRSWWPALAVAALVVVAIPLSLHLAGPAPTPTPRPTPTPVRREEGRLSIRLNRPDPALLDRVEKHFRACPGTVDARRTDSSLEIACVAPPSAAWTEFKAATGAFLGALEIRDGTWEWSLR